MKNNALTTILNWMLATSVLVSVICFVRFFNRTRDIRSYQRGVVAYQTTHTVLNMLIADTVEYSRRNPTNMAIAGILESVGYKPAQPAATKATGK